MTACGFCMRGRFALQPGRFTSCPYCDGSGVEALSKEDAACCQARRDPQGRLPIGYCSPDCERRPTT